VAGKKGDFSALQMKADITQGIASLRIALGYRDELNHDL
jgi:hypothetical protein